MLIEMDKLKNTYDSRRRHAERDPVFASVLIRAKVTLVHNVHSVAEAHNFEFESDELPEAGGSGVGPIPLDYFLAGFGFCFLSIMARTSASLGVSLDGASFSVKGLLDRRGAYGTPGIYSGFKEISYELSLTSGETEDRIGQLVKEVEFRCPAHATLEKATKLKQKVLLNGKPLGEAGKWRK